MTKTFVETEDGTTTTYVMTDEDIIAVVNKEDDELQLSINNYVKKMVAIMKESYKDDGLSQEQVHHHANNVFTKIREEEGFDLVNEIKFSQSLNKFDEWIGKEPVKSLDEWIEQTTTK